MPAAIISNPSIRKPKANDKRAVNLVRVFYRLRAMPKGESYVAAHPFRELLGINGLDTKSRVERRLKDLMAYGLIEGWQWTVFGGKRVMRVWVVDLPDVRFAADATDVTRHRESDFKAIERDWSDWVHTKLGIDNYVMTLKEKGLMSRLLKVSDRVTIRKAIKLYWKARAEYRRSADFTEFYKRFNALANDALDEAEVEKANEQADAKKTKTLRFYLEQELKRAKKRDDTVRVKQLTRQLEAIDEDD